jgi:hypothetical protein
MSVAAAGSADAFWSHFNEEITLLQGSIIGATQASDLIVLKDKLVEMQVYSTDSGLYLANYDVKRAQEILETTSKYIKEKEQQVQPRQKFTFKSKALVFGRQQAKREGRKNKAVDTKDENAKNSQQSINSTTSDTLFVVEDLKAGEVITLTAEKIGMVNGVMRALLIKNCAGATIFARCVLGAARIENCDACSIFLGPCSTSVYLDSITRGSIFICCHQLRIHKSAGVQLYVRVNGHPIIEDCTSMGFAPYKVVYAGLQADLTMAGLVDAACWDNVIDFRWHRATQSPNWHIIEERRRTVYQRVASTSEGGSETLWGEEVCDNVYDEEGGGGSAGASAGAGAGAGAQLGLLSSRLATGASAPSNDTAMPPPAPDATDAAANDDTNANANDDDSEDEM